MSLYRIPLLVCFVLGLFVSVCYVIQRKKESGIVAIRDCDDIKKMGVLRVVTNFNPFGCYPSGDTLSGFNHDVIQLLQSQSRIEVQINMTSTLEEGINGLMNGDYDLLASNVPVTTSLRKYMGFTRPIVENRLVLVQRKSDYNEGVEPIRSLLNLAGKTIDVPQKSPAIMRLKNISEEIGDTIYINEDIHSSIEQLMKKVAVRDLDLTICDEQAAYRLLDSLPELDCNTPLGFTHLEAWAVNGKSENLLDSLNVWIEKIQKTQDFENICNRYFVY